MVTALRASVRNNIITTVYDYKMLHQAVSVYECTIAAGAGSKLYRDTLHPLYGLTHPQCFNVVECEKQSCVLETMVSRLEYTRVHFVQISVSVSRPKKVLTTTLAKSRWARAPRVTS